MKQSKNTQLTILHLGMMTVKSFLAMSLAQLKVRSLTQPQTEVTTAGDFQLVKTVAWYDNEYGFTCQMIRLLEKFANL